jgi:hypothetical protein
VLLGEAYAARGPTAWFDRLLPFAASRQQELLYRDFTGEPVENELFHPAVRLADDRSGIRETWVGLPPFRTLAICDSIDPSGVILARAGMSVGRNFKPPILGYRRHGPGKLLCSAALPFWHWGFLNVGFGEDDALYGRFLEGVISWLTIPEDFDPIRAAPVKSVFERGEPVRFEAVAFDLGFRPIPGVSGTVELVGEGEADRFATDLIRQGEGLYEADFENLPPGRYEFAASIRNDGQLLKENRGSIHVEAFSLEDFDQSGDPSTLMAIANVSGGKYFAFGQQAECLAAIETGAVAERVNGEISVHNKFWLLLAFIGLLAVEWVVRKIHHLL